MTYLDTKCRQNYAPPLHNNDKFRIIVDVSSIIQFVQSKVNNFCGCQSLNDTYTSVHCNPRTTPSAECTVNKVIQQTDRQRDGRWCRYSNRRAITFVSGRYGRAITFSSFFVLSPRFSLDKFTYKVRLRIRQFSIKSEICSCGAVLNDLSKLRGKKAFRNKLELRKFSHPTPTSSTYLVRWY